MKKYIKEGFTLVELIVVVTILAILATIGFVSYSSYLTWVRDTNRLAQLVSIHDWLELYRTKKDLPLPDDNIEIKVWLNTIWYQWYAGANTLETIDFTKGWQDPKDGTYFTYFLSDDRKYFQLLAFLEEEQNTTTNFTNSSYALDYSNRIVNVYGDKLGILTDENNTPIQEVLNWEIDLLTTTENYTMNLTATDIYTSSWLALSVMEDIVKVWGRGYSVEWSTISYKNPDISIPRDWLLLELLFEWDTKDNTGQNSDGIISWTPLFETWVTNFWNELWQSIYINWTDDQIVFTSNTTLQKMSDSFSWTLWLKSWIQPDLYGRIIDMWDSTLSLGTANANWPRAWIYTWSSRSTIIEGVTTNDSKWHHIIFQRDWSNTMLYIDWVLQWTEAKTGTLTHSSSSFKTGS